MSNPFEDDRARQVSQTGRPVTRQPEEAYQQAQTELPHSPEAEMGVLCSAMVSREAFWGIKEKVDQDLFYVEQHHAIWQAIDVLHSKDSPVDPITIQKQVQKAGKNAEIRLIKDIYDFLPSANNWKNYLTICEETKHSRRLYSIARKMMRQATDPARHPQQIRAFAEKELEEIADKKDTIVSISDAVQLRMKDWDEAAKTKGKSSMGLLTGIEGWDKATLGCRGKTLHVIVGESKGGKTTLALQMATFPAIEENHPILFCSLEMSVESLVDKMVCGEGKISMKRLISGDLTPADGAKLMGAAMRIKNAPIHIWNGSHLTPQKFQSIAHRAKAEFGIKMIVVDYYQLMDGDDLKKNREQQLSDIGRAMRAVAKDLDIPIMLIAQLNDDGKLRESRSLKMHADTLTKITISKNDKTRHILNIEYNRDGETARIPCTFFKEHGRFEQVAPQDDDEAEEEND